MLLPAILSLEPIAVLTHDYHSRSRLYSWPPVPAEHLHQGELLSIKAFGSLLDDIRSPRHIYFASWRDPDPAVSLAPELGLPSTGILFGAQFGVAPYETSASLVETAEMFNRLDRAHLRLDLARDGDGILQLAALVVEFNDASSQKDRHFRSCWKGEEVKGLDLSLQFDAPTTGADAFRFHISARLPRRYNHGAVIEKEHVDFTASGGAMLLPRWVNY